MSLKSFTYDDCCLLIHIDLNSQRIRQLLERRFKCNYNRTSFDFKSLSPEQPSNNIKVSRSLLRFQPKIISTDDYEEHTSSELSSLDDDVEDDTDNDDNDEASFTNDDDYLNKLAEWEPHRFQPTVDPDEEDEDENNDDDDRNPNIFESLTQEVVNTSTAVNQMDCSLGRIIIRLAEKF